MLIVQQKIEQNKFRMRILNERNKNKCIKMCANTTKPFLEM